jgi:hypothetical protein
MPTRLLHAVPLLCLSGLMAACSWIRPGAEGGTTGAVERYRDILVIGLAQNPHLQTAFEDGFVSAFRAERIGAKAGHREIGSKGGVDGRTVDAAARRLGSDAVVVARVMARDDQEVYHAPRITTLPGTYGTPYGCCDRRSVYISQPGYTAKQRALRLETSLYDAASKRLVWSGRSVSLDPAPDERVIRELIAGLTAKMRAEGLLADGGPAEGLHHGQVVRPYRDLDRREAEGGGGLAGALAYQHQRGG